MTRESVFSRLLGKSGPVIMGILNCTPDSFSDGIKDAGVNDFLLRARRLIADGCDILDVGGESTRPNAPVVCLAEEEHRVLPFLEAFRKEFPDFPVSLDTNKFELALKAMPFGIDVLNDVSFFSDQRFERLVADHDCYYVLMHCRGDSRTMMLQVEYPEGVVVGVKKEIGAKLSEMRSRGFPLNRVILDVGFGFSKTPDQCVSLMEGLDGWTDFGLPLLFAVSRKRFLQQYTGECDPVARDQISAQFTKKALKQGFKIFRVHDVRETRRVIG